MADATKRDPIEPWAEAAHKLFELNQTSIFRLEPPTLGLDMPDVELEALCDVILAGISQTRPS